MKFDLHCHTSNGSLDAQVDILDYINLLKRQGIDGMLVTDHNSYKGYRAYGELQKAGKVPEDFVVLQGVEYDTLDAGHFLVIMPQGVNLRILEIRGLPLSILIHLVHENKGILGPAHPYGAKFLSAMHSKRLKRKPDTIYEFDFVEVLNTCELPQSNQLAEKMAKKYGIPGIAGSDSHKDTYVGTVYTEFDCPIYNNNDLILALRRGKQIHCYGEEREAKNPLLRRLLPLGLFFRIYNRGLGLLKANARRFHLKHLF